MNKNKEEIVRLYYKDEANKLHKTVDKIIKKLKFIDVEITDFYSLANEIFVDVINRWDEKRKFDTFLYSCLLNKFKSEMTKRNTQKRLADKMAISLETQICDDSSMTIGETIADRRIKSFDDVDDIFNDCEKKYSKKSLEYLKRLSYLQKEVLRFTIAGYSVKEIKEKLHITDKQYEDCQSAIHSYRNISILF